MESQVRKYVAVLVAGAALVAAACRDTIAPRFAARQPAAAKLTPFAGQPGVTAIRGNDRSEDDAKRFKFELRPKGGKVRVGGFILEYPADAVCDPATSSYGPTEWKNPCATITSPIEVTGRVWVDDGRTHADFSPDLRFNPEKDVYLTVKIKDIKRRVPESDWEDTYGIWYSVRIDDTRYFVNDALDNPELTTVFETDKKGKATGWMTRKIWHFSGYYVRAGRVCDDTSVDCGDAALQ